MAQITLMESDIELGRAIVRALRDSDVRVTTAFWYLDVEADEYCLALVSKLAAKGLKGAYRRLFEIVKADELGSALPLLRIRLMRPDAALPRAISRVLAADKSKRLELRLSNRWIDETHLEDVYVYRAA